MDMVRPRFARFFARYNPVTRPILLAEGPLESRTYPASFLAAQDWLGEIARKIREGGDQHPAKDLYNQIDQINDYTSQYYHGEDVADVTPDQIDPSELTGYVRRTLKGLRRTAR